MTQAKLMQIIQSVRHGNRHFKNEKNIWMVESLNLKQSIRWTLEMFIWE